MKRPVVADFLNALRNGEVQYTAERAFIVRGGEALDPVTGQATPLPEGAEDASTNNRMRREIGNAQAALNLLVGNDAERLDAAKAMLKGATPERLPHAGKSPGAGNECGGRKPSWRWPARQLCWAAQTPSSA